MPRIPGTGVYEQPAPDVITATTIESTVYNAFVNDVETDLNLPRPIVAGGTGATSAAGARDNLDAERSLQQVTNYDIHAWETGSFYSTAGATAAPNGSDHFFGIAYGDASNMFVEARSLTTGSLYIRKKATGSWGTWSASDADTWVNVAGDTMTGNLAINSLNPAIVLNKPGFGNTTAIQALTAGVQRWVMQIGNATAESGGSVGSDFVLNRYDNAGTLIDAPITILRSDGALRINNAGLYLNTSNFILSDATNFILRSGGTFSFQNNAGTVVKMALTSTGMQLGTSGMPGYAAALKVAYAGSSTQYGITFRPAADTTSPLIFENAASGGVGSISITTTNTAFNTASDVRLKEDLKSFDAGRIIDDTEVYNFAWKATGKRSYGVSAQQANEVYPEAVAYDKARDWWGIDYSKYIPVVLQELKALRARVAELEGRLEGKPA